MRIGNFIKDYLCKVQKEDIKFTSADILGHKLIVFIKQHIGEEQLKAVKAYCSGNDGRIFDLSMMLADLFMKYQSLDADVFADNANPHAQWQKYLYDNVCASEPTIRTSFDKCDSESMSLDSPVFYFGTERISPLYKKILDHIGNVQFFYTGEYDSKEAVESLPKVHISSAPSRIRELESVHTKVCELLKDGANLSEILVVIPGLDDYRTAIHQVFDIPKRDNNVHIPYSIVDTDENSSFTRDFLVKFFSIARNQDFTRKDFFEIVNNPVVRAARGITAADVESFEHWTDKMSIFRNGDNREDWNRAVERMLLARLSSQKVESIVPFEDMDSKSDAVLSKFIRCIDDLQAWVEMSGRGEIVHKDETLESLKDIVRSWIQIKLAPAELAGEQASYIGTIGSFKGLEAEKSAGAATISFDIISKTLLRGANASDYSPAELFVGGLSIMKFNPSRVIPAKYTFILGMDSRTMPGRDEKNTLDLREDKEGLVTPRSEENRRAFYTTLANTEGKIFYSFVDKDLTKDEEFFESAYLTDFGCRTEKLGIDETRSWKEIFTSRENRNKKRFEGLFGSGTDN